MHNQTERETDTNTRYWKIPFTGGGNFLYTREEKCRTKFSAESAVMKKAAFNITFRLSYSFSGERGRKKRPTNVYIDLIMRPGCPFMFCGPIRPFFPPRGVRNVSPTVTSSSGSLFFFFHPAAGGVEEGNKRRGFRRDRRSIFYLRYINISLSLLL